MNQRNRFPARRRFLKQSAALSASASLAAPAAVLAQVRGAPMAIGLLHPLTGVSPAAGPACGEAAALALRDAAEGPALRVEWSGYASAAGLDTAVQRLSCRVRACIVVGSAVPLPQLQGVVLSLAPAQLGATVLPRTPASSEQALAWRALLDAVPVSAQPALMGTYAAARLLAEVLPHATSHAEAVALLQAAGAQPWRDGETAPPLGTLIVVPAADPAGVLAPRRA